MMTTNVSNTAIQINDNQALERDSCNPPEAVTSRLEGASDTKKRKEKKRRKSLGQLGRGRARKWPVEWLPTIKALHGAKARCGNSNSPTYKKIKYRLDGKERKLIGRIGLWPGKGFTLERANFRGNYTLRNIKGWATRQEQANNRSTNVWLEDSDGTRRTIADWARRLDMNYKTLVSRYERGWEVSRILLTPVANPEEFRKAAGMRKRSRAETGLAHLILSQFLETYGPGPFMFMNCPKVFHVEGFENYPELQRLTNGAFDNQIAVAFQEDIHRRFPGVPNPRAVMRVMRATVPVELKYVYSLPAPADWQQIKCGISLEWGMTSLEVAREISARRIRDEEVLISRTWENKPREIHREHARKNGSISWEEWDEIVRFYMGRYGVDWWDKKRSLHLPVTIQLDRIWGDPLPPIDDPRLKVPMAQAYIARDPELRAIYGEILSEECLSRLAADG